HRAGFRRAADAAGAAGRQHVCQLPRSHPRAVAADAAADGGENPGRPGGGAAPLVPETGAGGRSRPGAGPGRGPRAPGAAGAPGAGGGLGRIGRAAASAGKDIDELRELLAAWRAAKASAWKAAADWIVRALFALLLIGLAVRLGFPEMLK